MLLTGVLIFIAPTTTTQVAAACVFAFGTLLGFELLRPNLDPADLWLYRLVSRYTISVPFAVMELKSGMEVGAEEMSPSRNLLYRPLVDRCVCAMKGSEVLSGHYELRLHRAFVTWLMRNKKRVGGGVPAGTTVVPTDSPESL